MITEVAAVVPVAEIPTNAEDEDQLMDDATPEVPQPGQNAEKRSNGEANEANLKKEAEAVKLEELFDMDEDDDEEFPGSAPPPPSIP